MSFFQRHLWTGLGLFLGPVITICSLIIHAYALIEMGFPAEVWVAFGLAIFFLSVIGVVYQQHKLIMGRVPTPVASVESGGLGDRSISRLLRENTAMIIIGCIILVFGGIYYLTPPIRPSGTAKATFVATITGPCDVHIDDVALAATLRGYLNKSNQPREVSIVVETGNLTCKYANDLRTAFMDAGWNPPPLKEIDREHLHGDAVWFQAPENDTLALQLFQYLETSQPIYFLTPQPASGGSGWVFWIKNTWPSWVPRVGGS
jgi:hypothetical protein